MRAPREHWIPARLVPAVADLLRAWDPEGLLRMGAPADEYDHEARAVAWSWYRMRDPESAARVLDEVLAHAFDHATPPLPAAGAWGARLWETARDLERAWRAEIG